MQQNDIGFAYVLSNPAWEIDGDSVVKIGSTKRAPHHRVRELSQGNLEPCVLVHSICVEDPAIVERTMHNLFQNRKHRSEFYRANTEDVLKVMSLFKTVRPTTTEKRKRIKTSKYPGVDFHRASGKYRARVRIKGEQHFVGLFETEDQAFIARQHYVAIY